MARLLLSLYIFALLLVPLAVTAKDCSECTLDRPCRYEIKQDCNTCSAITYCEDEHWYTDGTMTCTLKYCGMTTEIFNPFQPRQELEE
jgi:hypothetical protein